MPKMIGNWIEGATVIDANASADGADRVRISYAQARLLPAAAVTASLDTTDRGSARSLAKRWYRWFASAAAIEACTSSTKRMRELATLARVRPAANLFAAIGRVGAALAHQSTAHASRVHSTYKLGRCLADAALAALVISVLETRGLLAEVETARDRDVTSVATDAAIAATGAEATDVAKAMWHIRERATRRAMQVAA